MRLPAFLRILLASMLALCATAGRAHAITYLDTSYGTPTGTALGRGAAMGATGVSLFQGSQSLVNNPALLALQPQRVHGDFLFGVTQTAEDRLVPLYDSFDAYVNETTIATNRNTYAVAQGGLLWRLPQERPMTLAAGVYERYDFDYDYFEEVRDPDVFSDPRDALLGQRTLAVEGMLRSLSLGYGAEIIPPVRLGFSVHYYFGNVDMARKETDFQTNTSQSTTVRRELDGWGWSVGGQGSVNEHVDLAASYEGSFSVNGPHTLRETDTSLSQPVVRDLRTEETIDYPGTLRFGATYRPQNQLATTFSVEGVRRFWSDLNDSFRTTVLGDTYTLRDTWDLRVGLEHVFYNGMPLRFGFRYLENYADPEAKRSIFSAGLGYLFAGTHFDVTALYHRQTSRQEFLFDPSRLPDFPAPNSDVKVEDSILQLVFGISRTF